MKRVFFLTAFLATSSVVFSGVIDPGVIYRRGDANHDQTVNIADASWLYNYLFQGGPKPPCMNEADVNHDGLVDVSDPTFLTNFLYKGGPTPPAPGPYNTTCTESAAPVISCEAGCP